MDRLSCYFQTCVFIWVVCQLLMSHSILRIWLFVRFSSHFCFLWLVIFEEKIHLLRVRIQITQIVFPFWGKNHSDYKGKNQPELINEEGREGVAGWGGQLGGGAWRVVKDWSWGWETSWDIWDATAQSGWWSVTVTLCHTLYKGHITVIVSCGQGSGPPPASRVTSWCPPHAVWTQNVDEE